MFGEQFADHMFTAEWNEEKGWGTPEIKPLENLSLHPGASVLHYGIEVQRVMQYTLSDVCDVVAMRNGVFQSISCVVSNGVLCVHTAL